jgi:phosphatidylglycerophosphatase A
MKRLAASCFGLGRLPIAPGTWGSLPPVILFALLRYFHVSTAWVNIIMAALALVSSIICVKCAPASIAATGNSDPSEVVADECAGQALTYIFASALSGGTIWAATAGGFALFRVFDIVKPWPVRKLEKLPEGWGILADDLLAAVYAGIVLLIGSRLWNHWSAG